MTTEAKPSGQQPATPPASETKPDTTKPADGTAAAPAASEAKPDATKGADEKPAATSETKPDGKAAEATPPAKAETVYSLKAPEGAETWLDPRALTQVEAIAKAQGWTNEEAQAHLEAHVDAIIERNAALRAETEADPTYGGEHLEETQQLGRRLVDRVRPAGHPRRDSFLKMLADTGYGNHIEVVSFLADLGKMMREDAPPQAQSGDKGGSKDAATTLYGSEGKPS